MGIERHLDVDRAVNRFLKHFESLSRLPLVSDAEMDGLYGEEVSEGLAELECYNQQEKLCQDCRSRCCQLVDCELYAPDLSRCPIYSFRPALCRMHFCQKFVPRYSALVKETGDVFLEGLLAAEKINGRRASLFDSPPLGKLVPHLVAVVLSQISAIRENRLDEASALRKIQAEVEQA
jgi:hypothetical protein